METPPRILPLAAPGNRPLVSVMIPTYNSVLFLRQTLESVLSQSWAADKMEIVVVDNCSDKNDPEPLVREIGQGRISFYRNETNVGISGNFNRCIERARGHWIHILHSDDFVYDGFYDAFEAIAARHSCAAIAFRSKEVDATGLVKKETVDLSPPDSMAERRRYFLGGSPVLCPGVLVKRAAYERLGGFLTHFKFVLDMEMWSRLFFSVPTHFSSKSPAAFRWHTDSTGAQLRRVAAECLEHYAFIPYLQKNLATSPLEDRIYLNYCHRLANDRCRDLAKAGEFRLWLETQKLYRQHITNLRDAVDYALRFNRNFFWYLRGRLAALKSR